MLIQKLANNPIIQLHFHGIVTGKWKTKKYLEKIKHIKNVKFYGQFINSEKFKIYKNVTFINNIYGNSSYNARTLTSNKLYDAAI